MDSDLTNQDIYDADAFSTEEDNRVIELDNIQHIVWSKDLEMYPVNISEMDYFICQMDLQNVFKKFDVDDVVSLTPTRLDVLFLLLKVINLETVKYCEHVIRNFFVKEFDQLFFDNIMQITSFKKK